MNPLLREPLVVVAISIGLVSALWSVDEGRSPHADESSSGMAGQTGSTSEQAATPESERPDEVLGGIQSALQLLDVSDVQALARRLGIAEGGRDEVTAGARVSSLAELGDLDGDGIPEVALKWLLAEPRGQDPQSRQGPPASWGLFLLAWDGVRWRVSRLVAGAETVSFQVIRLEGAATRGIAVVTLDAPTAVPVPAVFRVKDHAATLIWDGQAEESRYRGYERGRVEFQDVKRNDPTEMIVTGRADPGLLVFAKGGRRGFGARTVYRWDGRAYIPYETQYSVNPDYTLYRFISALHLHDFKAAYALIDPEKFLNKESPNLEMFRQLIEESWAEFLDDQVFEAHETAPGLPDEYAFELPEKHYVYYPTFEAGEKFLLTGLERGEGEHRSGSVGILPGE